MSAVSQTKRRAERIDVTLCGDTPLAFVNARDGDALRVDIIDDRLRSLQAMIGIAMDSDEVNPEMREVLSHIWQSIDDTRTLSSATIRRAP